MKPVAVVVALCLIGCEHERGGPAEPAPAVPAPAFPVPPLPGAPHQLVTSERAPLEQPAPPFTLTASDGSGLELRRLDARAVVEGPLAFTELHLDFHNPEDRVREGTFAITLPAGASVSRLAMEIDGRFMEAAVVPRPLARRAYDDFLHRKQDPALMEKAAGNQFTARVFPIPARADKRLIISFSQELDGRPYTLPLRGLPRIDRVEVAVDVGGPGGARARHGLAERGWQPDRDVTAPAAPTAAVTADGLVVATLPFTGGAALAPEPPRRLVLAVDTSASRALGFARHVQAVRRLIGALRARHGDELALQVVAFDQEVATIFSGRAADYGDAHDRALLARGAAGASDLEALLATVARTPRAAGTRLLVVTDGVVTAGADTAQVLAAAAALPVDRIDVVLAGGLRDDELAAALVRAGRARAGDVFDLDGEDADAIAAGLAEPVAVDVAVFVPGATWVHPSRVPSVRAGRPVTVHARLPGRALTVDVVVGGQRHSLALASATPALVARAVAAAEVDELEQQLLVTTDAAAARALRDDLTRRSVAARVLSSQTSLLVLETEADYQRYGIDRSALGDLLVVGTAGLETVGPPLIAATTAAPSAGSPPLPSPEPPPAQGPFLDEPDDETDEVAADGDPADEAAGEAAPTREQEVALARTAGVLVGAGGGGTATGTIGLGATGTLGRGTGSGFGVGSGRGGMRARTASVPRVTVGAPAVQGSIDTALVRRAVRRHLPRIRTCYELELQRTPTLAGTVQTAFTILPDGGVTGVTATGVAPTVDACIAAALRDLKFPAVASRVVQVRYPIAFRPGAATTASDDDDADGRGGTPALTGPLADVTAALAAGNPARALSLARAWRDRQPGDVLALIALGEALEARRDLAGAARAYGSIIDLFPGRADLRRFAGQRLERVGRAPGARALAVDTYRRAVADRPDHLTGHRLLAYARLRAGDRAGAFDAILAGVDQPITDGRFAGADRLLDEDAGILAAVWLAAGGPRERITRDLARRDLAVATAPSTRIVLYWETDANDVDLHVRDRHGDHAYYSEPTLPSGGELYADVTTGYGPEVFTIPGTPTAGPYRLAADYYARGPMGYGMGLLQVQRFDGKAVRFDDRPFIIMNDRAMVDLGTL